MVGKRPVGISLLAILVPSLMAFGFVSQFLLGGTERIGIPEYVILGIIFIGFVGLSLGLWKLRRWARWVAIWIYAGWSFNLVPQLVSSMSPVSSDIVGPVLQLAIYGWIVWYLFRPHVKEAFGLQHKS